MKLQTIGVVAFAGILAVISTVQAEDSVLMAPVRLEADGKAMDSGEQWGHSSPCMEDLDGDGLKDLIVGDFSGRFRIYHNTGTASAPTFTDAGFIQAGGEPAKVNIYCCIGSQARLSISMRMGIGISSPIPMTPATAISSADSRTVNSPARSHFRIRPTLRSDRARSSSRTINRSAAFLRRSTGTPTVT